MAIRKGKNKIIIIDDDEDLLELLDVSFKAQGFETHKISNGKEALHYLLKEENTKSACLIILDRMLGDMEGLDVLRKYEEKFHNHLPVLILSVLSAEKDVIEGFKKGAVDYITKPFSIPILMNKAISLISQSTRGE